MMWQGGEYNENRRVVSYSRILKGKKRERVINVVIINFSNCNISTFIMHVCVLQFTQSVIVHIIADIVCNIVKYT